MIYFCSVSTTGMLAGIKMSHAAVTSLCRSMKLACELYPSRHIALCLDPYSGLGFALWCLSRYVVVIERYTRTVVTTPPLPNYRRLTLTFIRLQRVLRSSFYPHTAIRSRNQSGTMVDGRQPVSGAGHVLFIR